MKLSTAPLAALALTVAGCGPTVPLDLAMRQQQVDVKFAGPQASPSPAPPLAYTLPPPLNLSGVTAAAPPVTVQPSPCPALAELAVAKDPATSGIANPPPTGSYPMRSGGTFSLGSSLKGTLSPVLTNLRSDSPHPGSDSLDGAYQDYLVFLAHDFQNYWAFDFRLANDKPGTPGIQLVSMGWKDAVRGDFAFFPTVPLQFIQTPLAIGNSWSSAGLDPNNQTSVQISGSVPAKVTVNACGVALDAYQVHIDGHIASPTLQLTWTADYDIGSQYGGLILAEHVQLGGPDSVRKSGDMYSYDETSIINSVPPKA